jgi:L-alanine-DL-glutamate epimerase-like enolase superfamily enzyme
MTFPGDVLLEYAPPGLYPTARVRSELFGPEPVIDHGVCQEPTQPGFGVELDEEAVKRFSVASARWEL